MAKKRIDPFSSDKRSPFEIYRETLRSGPTAKRQLIFILSMGISFLLLSVLSIVFYFLHLSPWYFVTGGLAILLMIVFFFHTLHSFANLVSSRSKIASSLLDQLDTFMLGEAKLVSTRWPLESYNRIQKKLNDTIEYFSNLIATSKTKEGKRATTKECIPWGEFCELIPSEIAMNPSHDSAIVIFSLYGESSPSPKAVDSLRSMLRREFSEDLLVNVDYSSVGVFVYSVDSKTSFEGRLRQIISNFSYCETSRQTGEISAYGLRVGGAYYPGFEASSLPYAAKRASARSTGLRMDEGKDIDWNNPFSGSNLSENAERVETLRLEAAFMNGISMASDHGQERNILERALTSMEGLCGFSESGVYLHSPALKRYHAFLSHHGEEYSGLLRLGNIVPEEKFAPVLSMLEKESPLFCNNVSSLPEEVATLFSSLGIESVYLCPMINEKQVKGFVFFSSPKSFEFRLFFRERMQSFLPFFIAKTLQSAVKDDIAYYKMEINAMASRKELYAYTVERTSYRLLSFSENLGQKRKAVAPGHICYQALYGLDAPCDNCPLLFGAGTRVVPFLSSKNMAQSILSYREGEEGIVTVLLEKDEERFAGTSLIDKSLLIKNARAFQIDLNRELRLSLNQGYYLGIRLNNREAILRELPNQSINSLMGALSREISSVGYDEVAYRFDAETLAVHFPGITNRTLLYVAVETIADAISRPLFCGEDSFQPLLSFALVGYPSDATTPADLTSLLTSELRRSAKLGYGVVAEVGKAKARKALRQDYIHSILEANLRQSKIDLLFTPILETRQGRVAILKATPIVYEEGRKRIRDAEFLKIAKIFRMQETLDFALLRCFLAYYQEHLAASHASISYLMVPMSPETACAPGAKEKILAIKKEFGIPDHFLLFCFAAPSIARASESLGGAIRYLHEEGIAVLADRYSPDVFPLKRLAEMGVDGIIASPYFLQEALLSESDRLLFGSYVKDAKGLGLIELASGVENEDGKKFVTGLGIPFYFGPLNGEAMEPSELQTFLNYQK